MEKDSRRSEVRDGVRSGILSAIRSDVELRGGRTARLLVAAGVAGVVGAIGVTLLLSGHPFDHHPPWHVTVFSMVWAGLLVVSFAIAFLGVRTPSLPLSHSASVALLGLGIAGICGAACADQHFLNWWTATDLGRRIFDVAGLPASAFCFGLVATLLIGAASVFLVLGVGRGQLARPMIPAAAMFLLLLPGVALQSVDNSVWVFAAWIAGTAAGGYLGVTSAIQARAFFSGT